MHQGKTSAFTIVEVLIVIVVIGILATFSLVAYSGIQSQAAAVVLKSDLKSASTQLELDRIIKGTYPATATEANDGKGLPASPDSTYEYTLTDGEYCLSATSPRAGMKAYHISSIVGSIEEGVCAGHTAPTGGGSNPPASTVPSAPTAVSATGGEAQATVSWAASSDDGGSAITSYVVTATPGGQTATAGSAATSATVSGLSNGTSYTFTVKATNAIGSSPASAASNVVTPAAAPNTPVTMTADQVWTPQQVYDWNPNWSNFAYTPPGGSFGAQAISLSGVSYRWMHYNSVWPVDISVAKPSASNLAAKQSSAAASGAAANWGPGIDGYFSVSGGQGHAQVFYGGYWVIVSDEMSSSAPDISQIVNNAVSNLP